MKDPGDSRRGLMANSELWGGLVGLALGLFVIWSGIALKIGVINDPGPGFVMFYTGIAMCLFAVTIMTSALTEGGPAIGALWAGTRWNKPAIIIASLVAFCFALQPLGFLLSSIPLMVLLLRAIDPVRWTTTVLTAVIAPLTAWWILKRLLSIQLPSGIFDIG